MRISLFLFFAMVIISMSSVYALNCSYTEDILSSKIVYQVYKEGIKVENISIDLALEPGGCPWHQCSPAVITIYNKFNESLDGQIYFVVNGQGDNETVHVDPLGHSSVSRAWSSWDNPINIDLNTVRFENLNNSIEVKRENLTWITGEVCKQCLGVDCLNDGLSCTTNSQCGGSFCIQGLCTNSNKCYNNNCNCSSTEIQCPDDTKCAKIGKIPEDSPTTCGLAQECETGYLNYSSRLCGKSPSQLKAEEENRIREQQRIEEQRLKETRDFELQKEKDKAGRIRSYSILGIIFIIALFTGTTLYVYHRKKLLIEKQKAIDKEIWALEEKRKAENEELGRIKKDIEDIERAKKVRREELDNLDKLKDRREKIIEEIREKDDLIEKKWSEIKPFPDKWANGRLVIVNPYLGGYLCFYDDRLSLEDYTYSSLLHRWVWKKNNGRWPKEGHHIHHKDGDKYNNDPSNLEEIRGDEHYEMHRRGLKKE